MISLRDLNYIGGDHHEWVLGQLYALLGERDPIANISHRNMPTWEKHREFVQNYLWNRPDGYRDWWLIMPNGDWDTACYGACYLTRRLEIGIQIAKMHQGKGYATAALHKVIEKNPGERLLANIAPGNVASQKLFAKFGFTHIQNTYERR